MNYRDNDKRFTVKLLGVFQMDAQNFTPYRTMDYGRDGAGEIARMAEHLYSVRGGMRTIN